MKCLLLALSSCSFCCFCRILGKFMRFSSRALRKALLCWEDVTNITFRLRKSKLSCLVSRLWRSFGAVLYVAFQSVLLRRTVLHLELLRVPFALFGITLLMAATGAFLLDKPAAESPFSVNISQVLDGFLWLKQFVFLDVFKERHTGNRGESLSLHFSSSPHFGASHHTFVDSFEIITEILVEFCTILVVEVADFLQR